MLQPRQARFGTLDGFVVDPDPNTVPDALVVLCHGYGAPGSDLLGVVGEWIDALADAAPRFRFICPVAPHSLADIGLPTGRAWWPLNMQRMMDAIEAQQFDELHQHEPAGIDAARDALAGLIRLASDELRSQHGDAPESIPLAIGGFSQGAMLTMDTALRSEIEPPQLLIQFSGTLICQPQWTAALPRLRATRVYQSHGTIDPILPFASAEKLRDLLRGAEIDIRFHSFTGPHTIDQESIVATATALNQLIS